MKNFLKKYWFGIIIIVLCLIKQRIVTLLPLLPIYAAGAADDLLMARMADRLICFKWFTETLMLTKGCGFPLFLALGVFFGIGYAALVSLFHSLSSVVMMLAVKPLLRKKWMQIIFFTVLLFLPAAFIISQRVYRNAITIWQVLLILASLFAMLLRLHETPKRLLLWAIPGMIGLTWIYHTREDSVWCVLFALGMLVVSLFFLAFAYCWKSKEFAIRSSIFSLPLLTLIFSITVISSVNFFVNFFWGTTFFASGSCSRMVKMIYSINWPDSQQLPPRLAISRAQIKDLYNYSPTLKKNQENIKKSLDIFSRTGVNGEVENGGIFWSMLLWTNHNPAEAKIFFNSVTEELAAAVEAGKLKKRPVMPSALMAPWKPSAYPGFQAAFVKSWKHLLTQYNHPIYLGKSSEEITGVRYLENFIGRKFEHVSDIKCGMDRHQKRAIKILKRVDLLYQKIATLLNILGIAGFIVIVVKLFLSWKNMEIDLLKTIFFLLGIIASCTVLIIGISYTDATGFDAVHPCYLAGGYPIILVFDMLSFFIAWNIVADLLKKTGALKHVEKNLEIIFLKRSSTDMSNFLHQVKGKVFFLLRLLFACGIPLLIFFYHKYEFTIKFNSSADPSVVKIFYGSPFDESRSLHTSGTEKKFTINSFMRITHFRIDIDHPSMPFYDLEEVKVNNVVLKGKDLFKCIHRTSYLRPELIGNTLRLHLNYDQRITNQKAFPDLDYHIGLKLPSYYSYADYNPLSLGIKILIFILSSVLLFITFQRIWSVLILDNARKNTN